MREDKVGHRLSDARFGHPRTQASPQTMYCQVLVKLLDSVEQAVLMRWFPSEDVPTTLGERSKAGNNGESRHAKRLSMRLARFHARGGCDPDRPI